LTGKIQTDSKMYMTGKKKKNPEQSKGKKTKLQG
jgi:hypothetical protein